MLNHERVRELEDELEGAIAHALENFGKHHQFKQPRPRTCHLMAKAAVAVLEAVEENAQT